MNRQEYTLPCPNDGSYPHIIYLPISWEICNYIPIATIWFSDIKDDDCYLYLSGNPPKLPLESSCVYTHYMPIETDENTVLCILVVSDLQERETKECELRVPLERESTKRVWLNSIEWISLNTLLEYDWKKCGPQIYPKWFARMRQKEQIEKELTKDLGNLDNDYNIIPSRISNIPKK